MEKYCCKCKCSDIDLQGEVPIKIDCDSKAELEGTENDCKPELEKMGLTEDEQTNPAASGSNVTVTEIQPITIEPVNITDIRNNPLKEAIKTRLQELEVSAKNLMGERESLLKEIEDMESAYTSALENLSKVKDILEDV